MNSFSHVMNSQNVRSVLHSRKMKHLSCRKRILRRDTEKFIYHALSGNADQYFRRQAVSSADLPQPVQLIQKSIVLLYVLGKTESRIKYPILDPIICSLDGEIAEVPYYILRHICIVSKRLHILRSPSHVHGHIGKAKSTSYRQQYH